MKKGYYGEYTGNARHSRKQEMIHDRELIYDAKSDIHSEDKKYRDSGSDSDKRDMIHERELIHDTKTQLHHADQDYKSDGPKMRSQGPKATTGGYSFSSGIKPGLAYNYMNPELGAEDVDVAGAKGIADAAQKTAGEISSVITAIDKNKEGSEGGSIETKPMRDAKTFKGNFGDTSSTLNPYGFGGEFDLVSKSQKPIYRLDTY